jgi:hypothetical protein
MKTTAWFGRMTHGTFAIAGDSTPMVIVHSIDHVEQRMTEEQADDYMTANGYDSYLMPKIFKGEIVYDDSFTIVLGEDEEAA